ncbi:MAG: hypothetical protein AAF770_00840 [Bacteroidota bacterium]
MLPNKVYQKTERREQELRKLLATLLIERAAATLYAFYSQLQERY